MQHRSTTTKEVNMTSSERFFATCGGVVIKLEHVVYVPERFLNAWKGIKTIPEKSVRITGSIGPNSRTYCYAVGRCPQCGNHHIAERQIFRKANPSNHKCDARCLAATGHNCECSCGGKNHGKHA